MATTAVKATAVSITSRERRSCVMGLPLTSKTHRSPTPQSKYADEANCKSPPTSIKLRVI